MQKLFKITLQNDYAFKRVFGVEENKDVLQDLLECILDIPPETIAGLELLDKEFHKELLSEKLGILDIKLRLKDGTFVDIEIQNNWHFDFPERTLYYWSKMYNENIKQGQDYTKLPKCITINLIGKGFDKNKRLHNKYLVLEQDTKEPLVSKLEIHILNLEKANAAISVMEMSPRDKWLYDSRMKYEHDRASCISEGYRQGLERGLDKGAYQKALETAKLMRMHNYPIAEICTISGLTKEEVEAIN